jgi:hypothetical protein
MTIFFSIVFLFLFLVSCWLCHQATSDKQSMDDQQGWAMLFVFVAIPSWILFLIGWIIWLIFR